MEERERISLSGAVLGASCIYSAVCSPIISFSSCPLGSKVGGYVSALREKNDIFLSVFGDLEPKPTL